MRKFLSGVVIASLLVVSGFLLQNGSRVEAATPGCDKYAIMRCGATDPADFVRKARIDRKTDLQAIYSNFGLSSAEYDRFASSAKQGTMYKDGRIIVDGVNVGRSTMNVGRVQEGGFNQAVNIGGNTYWGGAFGSTYHADTAQVSVLFNDEGVMQFVIINSCANPQRFTPNKPVYSCDKLQKKAVDGKANTYRFTTKATATQGAQLVKAEYMFGNGDTQTVTDLSTPVERTFTKDTTVRVRIFVKLPGGGTKTVTSVDCFTQITFNQPQTPTTPPVVTPPTPQPPTPQPMPNAYCSLLQAEKIDEDNMTYRFTANASLTGVAALKGADFDFGDGTKATGAMANGNAVTINHSYGKAGNYTTTATLHFTSSDGSALPDSNCSVGITPTSVTTTPSSEPTLTKTGTGMIATVFAGAALVGIAGHQIVRRRILG
jgi:hypothetical protein